MKQQIEILDKSCTVYQRGDVPQMLLLQLVDEHDREELDTEMEWIVSHSTVDFRFIAVHVDRWFDELAPGQRHPFLARLLSAMVPLRPSTASDRLPVRSNNVWLHL